jgi:hypothetical protein
MTVDAASTTIALEIFQKYNVDHAVCDVILPFEQLSLAWLFRYYYYYYYF